MQLDIISKLIVRDLAKLQEEIQLYKNEAVIWKTDKQITNSAGNLALHLVGNLITYIGKELGQTGYVRNRDLEFSQKNVPRTVLVRMIAETSEVVISTLKNFDESKLSSDFPVVVFKEKTSTGYMLMHLTSHLAYHLGQVNYHRRLLDAE